MPFVFEVGHTKGHFIKKNHSDSSFHFLDHTSIDHQLVGLEQDTQTAILRGFIVIRPFAGSHHGTTCSSSELARYAPHFHCDSLDRGGAHKRTFSKSSMVIGPLVF